jgi:hypothetical protein
MHVRAQSGEPRSVSSTTGLVRVVLAIAAAVTAAAAVTIASSSRLPGPNVTAVARASLPITTTVNRHLKGDRLDRADAQPSNSGEAKSPEGIVPKTVPMPPDPAGSPHEDLLGGKQLSADSRAVSPIYPTARSSNC